jgi:hypothetical protein
MKCRLCDSENLYLFLDLGFHPPSDQFRTRDQLNTSVVFYPLEVNLCESCGFVQLGYVVPPEILYQDNYPYESSITQMGRNHYFEFARSVVEGFNLHTNDLAVDIGSNVGVLLEGFRTLGLRVQGIDPAPNICQIAEKRGIPTINAFFDESSARRVVEKLGLATVITGTNVFAHVDDLNAFMRAVNLLLDPKRGIFVIEAPYFLHLVETLEYDTIYHEHLSYLSIEPLIPYFQKFGMEIVNIEEKDIHGGSIRIFISAIGNYPVGENVSKFLEIEKIADLRSKKTLNNFALRVAENKLKLQLLLANLKASGKKIVAVSAPAKGMTLLNYCKIDGQLIDFVTEKSKLKIGSYTPGGLIPIYSDDSLLDEAPDYALLLAWNFATEIMYNNKEFIARGGKFIIPIPEPRIV